MRALFHPRIKRTTVWVVLGVWLFALAAGMANACLLEPETQHEHSGSQGVAIDRHVHAGHAAAHVGHAFTDDHHDEGSSKVPCVKVCGEASHSPIQKPSTFSFDLPGIAASPILAWPAVRPPAAVAEPTGNPAPFPPEPPPRLRFARLAL